MSKPYEIIDTIIVPNAGRTDSVRISATRNSSNEPALKWNFHDGCTTVFGDDAAKARQVNEFMAVMLDDETAVEEMNLFTDKHTS